MPIYLLFSRKTYYAIIVLLLLLFASTLYHRISHFDDAWFAEQSYRLLQDGIVRSELFRGYNFWHERLYVFHKVFVYVEAALLSGLGFSVWAARATPLLFTGACLLLLLRYFKRQPEARWLAAVLYVGCGTVWLFGVDNRPETMVAAFGFGSFLLLSRPSLSTGRLVAAGILAGLAGLTHLNGIIYVAAGTFWLLPRRGWWPAFWFGLAGTLTVSIYLLDGLQDNRLDLVLYQFRHDHVTQANFHWWSKLKVMADYHQLFLHSEGESFLTVLFLLMVLAAARWRGARVLTPAMQYLLLLVGLFWLLTKSNNAYYYLLLVPFLIVTLVEITLTILPTLSRQQRQLVVLAFCAYPLGSGMRAYYLVRENQTYPDTLVENARLAAHMPRQGAKVIAPIDFFFGQVANYRVRGLTYYALLSANEYAGQLPLNTFFALAAQDSVRYIVTDHRRWNQAYYVPPGAPSQVGPYQRVFHDKWHSIYVRQDSLPQAAAARSAVALPHHFTSVRRSSVPTVR